MSNSVPKMLKAKEVAERWQISLSQVYALVADGTLKAFKLTTGKQGGMRFTEQQLADCLEACLTSNEKADTLSLQSHVDQVG